MAADLDNREDENFEVNEGREELPNQHERQLPQRPPTNGERIYFYCSVVGTVWFVASLFVLGLLVYWSMSCSSQREIAMNDYKHCQTDTVRCREQYKVDLEEHKKRYQADIRECNKQCKADLEEWKEQYKFEREHSIKQDAEMISRTDESSVTESNLSECNSERYYSRIIIGVLCCILLCCAAISTIHQAIRHQARHQGSRVVLVSYN